MAIKELFVGKNQILSNKGNASGSYILIGNEKFYEIKGYDSMLPFFICIASDSNHWMYISSTGGLTAGRISPDNALFPYYTDDKIHESYEITGSKTIIQVLQNGKWFLWEPFSERNKGVYAIERSILKSTVGNKIIFQEKNRELGLTFCYGWMNSDEFGWVKKSWLINNSVQIIEVNILDGLQNILPYGVNEFTQSKFSTLVDAYKKSELIPKANLALFRMESIMADRAEPSEALKVTTVWCTGLENCSFLLNSNQIDDFRLGKDVVPETESKGVRGAFFALNNFSIEPFGNKSWYFVAEVNQDSVKVNNLIDFIQRNKNIPSILEGNIEKGTTTLQSLIAQADGIQNTADENIVARHFSNTLFNVMRGGIYNEDYKIYASDLIEHIKHQNRKVWSKHETFLLKLPVSLSYLDLEKLVKHENDSNLYRLFLEYLPLTFSRRHGDPSRPWNMFNINIKDSQGNRLLSYQGNWRDIFQNWEALSLSYPGYINGIIAKFLNASTADGYNPYRVTSGGIDWEVIEHDNPWSNIGYWGDHQIIYLLKLMEVSKNHFPDGLVTLLDKELFAYSNVPYRIKSYSEIVANPKNTVLFDESLNQSIEKLVDGFGADAKLILNQNGEVKLVNLTEKLLVPLLAKLSNFIPDAGIWMNTLRPEWNDANNALVGFGASMVTLYHMRRYVAFIQSLYNDSQLENFEISEELAAFYYEIDLVLNLQSSNLLTGFNDTQRRTITNQLGKAGENYRNKVYQGFSGNKRKIEKDSLLKFSQVTLDFIDQSISLNKRPNSMYHAYNLVNFTDDSISIRHLNEMLEGQVAILSSGKLEISETLDLLKALRNSSLYRSDQESYILYPNKKLPLFLDKNTISEESINAIGRLKELVDNGNFNIVKRDNLGQYHFNADFINVDYLKKTIVKLQTQNIVFTDKEQKEILDLYEKIFDHQSFTGRSGTFYKYEGLGSIYWHMVSKLLLSIGESIQNAILKEGDPNLINQLIGYYYEVKKGIGAHKLPSEYGSFPFDPYSHTPIMAGVQQPGMTGQVKEDIISRFFELGVIVRNGQIEINPIILRKIEFIDTKEKTVDFKAPWLKFTYCAVPIIFLLDYKQGVDVEFSNGEKLFVDSTVLPLSISQSIFYRKNEVQQLIVHVSNVLS